MFREVSKENAFHDILNQILENIQNGSLKPGDALDVYKRQVLKKIRDTAEESGMKFILHCCGRSETMLECFHQVGIRRLEPCQPINDICAMKLSLIHI